MTESVQTSLIVAGSALFGALVASANTWILHWLNARKERHRLLRKKLELLSMLVSESLPWISEVSECRSLEELASCAQCPQVRQALILSSLYFQELHKPIAEYQNCIIRIHNMFVDAFDPARPSTAGADAARHPEHKDLILQGVKLRQNIDDAIQRNAKKYTKA